MAFVFCSDGHNYKKDERFDFGAKAGDVFATQRRYPQPMYWDYKVGVCVCLSLLVCSKPLITNTYKQGVAGYMNDRTGVLKS